MKLNFKSICKDLNAYAESDSYDKPAVIRVEHTSFQSIHKAQAGRNGVGELVELVTRVIEAEGVHIANHDRSNLISVYIRARTRSGHGFGSDAGTFLRLKDANGKYHSVEVHTRFRTEEIGIDNLKRVIGDTVPADFVPEEFAQFVESETAKVVGIKGKRPTVDTESLRREFSKKFYQELVQYEFDRNMGSEQFAKLLSFAGVSLVTQFKFTDRLWCISPDYVDQTKQGLEIGWTERHTYNSLPATLRLTKTREIKTIKLADIGVEGPGYYNHGDNMRVLPEQVAMVKRFASRFRSKRAKVTEKLLESMEKVG